MTLYDKVYNLFHQWLNTTNEDFEEFCEWISNQDAIISQENSSSDSQLKQKLKKLSFFTHYPKKHTTLTINNVTEEYLSKKEMWKKWLSRTTIDQTILKDTSHPHECNIYLLSLSSRYYLMVRGWEPRNYSSKQTVSLQYTRNTGRTSSKSGHMDGFTTGGYISFNLQSNTLEDFSGTFYVTIPEYLDEENNIYYTGVKYSVTATSPSTSYKYFTVNYL